MKRRASTIEASIEKLPKGWKTVEVVRKSGKTAERVIDISSHRRKTI